MHKKTFGFPLPGALAIPVPGERTISNAAVALATDSSISPGPPSPWLPALPIENRSLSFLRRTAGALARGARMAKTVSAAPHPAPGDARGEAPCIRKPKNSPFPAGEGGRGDGGRIKTKGGGGKRQGKHTPPPGTTAAGRAANAGSKPPAGRVVCLPVPVPPGFSPRGCKGRSPLHKITLIPPSRWEERSASAGRGDGGRKEREGSVSRRQRKHAPTGARVWQGQPAPQAV